MSYSTYYSIFKSQKRSIEALNFFLSIIFLAFVYSKGYTIAIKSNN